MFSSKDKTSIKCRFCRGTGLIPGSKDAVCPVCKGKLCNEIAKPYTICKPCRGTGSTHMTALTCTTCGGKGMVGAPTEPVLQCPECRGTGEDAGNPALSCLKCRGKGWVPKKVRK